MARSVTGSRIISGGSSSPDLLLVRCFEDFEATALLKAKSDGTVTVDIPVPASNKPDRLRSVGCPSDMIDQIGGWSKETVGQGYGLGYELTSTYEWLIKI